MAFGEKQRLIDDLTSRNHALEAENERLQLADRIAQQVHQELGSIATQTLIESDAVATARVAVESEERERLTRETAERIKRERYEEFAASVRANEAGTIRAELVDLFTSDGTFARLGEEAKDKLVVDLQDEVIDEERQRVIEEFQAPDKRSALRSDVRARMEQGGELDELRRTVEQNIIAESNDALEAEVREEVEAEERTREDAIQNERKDVWRQSKKIATFRSKVRAELTEIWDKASYQEVADEVKNEEFNAIIERVQELHKRRLLKEVKQGELYDEFVGLGVDVTELVEGDILKIELGKFYKKDMTKQEQYLDSRRIQRTKDVIVPTPAIKLKRTLVLCALGDGRFRLDSDSLRESSSVYERNATIARGTVIIVGHKISDTGNAYIKQRLAADVPLFYDTDTSDENITDAILPVANLIINGVSARAIDIRE